jgi:phosphate starvation-inducible PhoH-like protein
MFIVFKYLEVSFFLNINPMSVSAFLYKSLRPLPPCANSRKSKTVDIVEMKGGNRRGKHRFRDLVFDTDDDSLYGRSMETDNDSLLGNSPQGHGSPAGYMNAYRAFRASLNDEFPLAVSSGKQYTPPVIKPRNDLQKTYMEAMEKDTHSILIATGPAGTGKTILACHLGLRKLQSGAIQKLILTRPAVSVEEQHGFLPGSLEEKMEPWLRPVYDVFYQYFSPQKLQKLISQQVIEICPLAYMRGRTFENAWIIADEAQNMTPNQMLMLLTRIGNNSKMIITGDPRQHDRGFEVNGLSDFLERYKKKQRQLAILETSFNDVCVIEFTFKDVERHPVIRKILALYDENPKQSGHP